MLHSCKNGFLKLPRVNKNWQVSLLHILRRLYNDSWLGYKVTSGRLWAHAWCFHCANHSRLLVRLMRVFTFLKIMKGGKLFHF